MTTPAKPADDGKTAPELLLENAKKVAADDAAKTDEAPTDSFSWAAFTEAAEEVTEGSAITLSDIPVDIRDAVERSFTKEKGLRFKFPSKKIADDFLNLARKYGELRAEGRLTIRTTKLDDASSVQFRAKKFEARTTS